MDWKQLKMWPGATTGGARYWCGSHRVSERENAAVAMRIKMVRR